MATRSKIIKKSRKRPKSDGDAKIRIRMYRVGFGDAFLVELPTASESKFILVDCGVHARGDIHTIAQAVNDIATVTKKKLAILVATHAHQDHISGFGQMESVFRTFSIGEVWLPWTEDPKDEDATKLRNKRVALLEMMRTHFAATDVNSPAAAAVANMSVDKRALDALHAGFGVGAQVRYFQAGMDDLEAPGGISGLTVKVLGPPRDPQLLAKMDPPAGQHYLRMDDDGNVAPANALQPFGTRWRASREQQRTVVTEDEELLNQRAGGSLGELAFALDQAINNTSIVVLLQYQGHSLLFAGDAQFGNWKCWLDEKGSDDILEQVDFYKVAHHGSVNATPKPALEKMGHGTLAAMVSTQNVPWPSIPEKNLMEALDQRTQHDYVRSDSLVLAAAPDAPQGPALSTLPEGFSCGELFYEYVIS